MSQNFRLFHVSNFLKLSNFSAYVYVVRDGTCSRPRPDRGHGAGRARLDTDLAGAVSTRGRSSIARHQLNTVRLTEEVDVSLMNIRILVRYCYLCCGLWQTCPFA